MATFIMQPSFAPVSTRTPRVLVTKFGDGYEQRGLDGINPDMQNWQLTFAVLPVADADTIEGFFVTNNTAVFNFTWTPPRSVTAYKYLCRSWTRTTVSPNTDSITATFEQVPEP